MGFLFATRVWHGEPISAEPDKCAGLPWVDPDGLPPHTVAYGAAGLRADRSGAPFALHGWDPDAARTLAIGPAQS